MRFVNHWIAKNGLLLAGCLSLFLTTGCQWAQTSWDATRSSLGSLAWWQNEGDSPSGTHDDGLRPPSSEFNPGNSRIARNQPYVDSGNDYGRGGGYSPKGARTDGYGSNTYTPSGQGLSGNSGSMSNYGNNSAPSNMNPSPYGNNSSSNSMSKGYGGSNTGMRQTPYGGTNNSAPNTFGGSNNLSPSSPYGGQSSGFNSSYPPSNGLPSSGYSPRSSNSNPLKVNNPHVSPSSTMSSGVAPAGSTQQLGANDPVTTADYKSTGYNSFQPRDPNTQPNSTSPPPSSFDASQGMPSTDTSSVKPTGAPLGSWAPGSTNSTSPMTRSASLPASMMGSQPPSSNLGGGGSFSPGQ